MRRLIIAVVLLGAMVGCARPAAVPPAPVEAREPAPSVVAQPPVAAQPPAVNPPPATTQPPADPPQVPHYRLTLYTLQHLQGHKAPPPETWAFQASFTGFRLAPDGETALLYPADPYQLADPPALLHLPTGKRTPLPVPAKDWYCCGGWLSDGRLYLVGGGKVYLGQGADLQPLADVGLVWTAAPSPDGKALALWAPGEAGTVTLVDLTTGKSRPLATAFRRCAEDGSVSLGWSPDSQQLAGTDCQEQKPRVQIVDPASDRLVKVIDGWSLQTWLSTGELLAISPNPDEAYMTTRVDPKSGKELGPGRPLGSPSPDGKYLFYNAYKRQYVLLESATGQSWAVDLAPDRIGWTADGRLYVITRQ